MFFDLEVWEKLSYFAPAFENNGCHEKQTGRAIGWSLNNESKESF